ncbi:Cytochrome c biogenesis factor CcmF [Methanonatronarchaeum thermophilum]|uniref:Cytochrome c biogenesis factor CcmF n=1 Tax=Methanonatronarchaeum thermophilum TaxID=1927129 RepID=A0A1Y3GAT0_9EURY|nr:cytochrome c biogenesis protein CcsA [Methanonatronarchaeum thermophilum]OUJ18552.1 Cytochrome c biogenesis factor CcmF [Methanonatronarchaeum thermophilum]
MIELESLLIIATFVGLLVVSSISIRNYFYPEKYVGWVWKLNVFSLTIFVISFLIFAYYCVTANPDVFYSFAYGDPEYPWYYALSTIWAGEQGSIYFWTTLIAISIVVVEIFQIKNTSKKTQDIFRATVSLITLGFILILLIESPFQPTEEMLALNNIPGEEADYIEQGFAMSPILLNPWMAIHPPIIFVGYAFFTIPIAISLSYGFTYTDKWNKISLVWSRLGWLFLTLGIAIGAYWAYLTLGWGGYWAWDPVESASLLPWLTSTALLHMLWMNKNNGRYEYLSHMFIIITFSLIMFTTFVTRGGLPIEGPHTWGAAVGPVQAILLSMITIPLVIGTYLIWKKQKKDQSG